MQVGHFARDHIERNLACVLAGRAAERRRNIKQTPNAVLREADKALLGLIERFPKATTKAIGLVIPPGTQFIGAGSENTVIRCGGNARKIHRASVYMTLAEREAMVARLQALHATLGEQLGEIVVPQVTRAGRHPLRTNAFAVIADQPIVQFQPLDIFYAHRANVDASALQGWLERYPFLAHELHHVADAGLRLYRDMGLLLDTSGMDNLVLAETPGGLALRCLDGIPISSAKAHDTQRILGQLNELQRLTRVT